VADEIYANPGRKSELERVYDVLDLLRLLLYLGDQSAMEIARDDASQFANNKL
jgi:hypothetical protein